MIIITGAAGFIGSCMVAYLNATGREDLLLCDNLGCEDKWKNLNGKKYHDFILQDDFYSNIENYIKQDDCVIHLGANASTTERDMDSLVRSNYNCSKLIFETCSKKKARFIYASSASVYGNADGGFSEEDAAKSLPINKYALSKAMFDQWQVQQTNRPSQCVGLRFFNVYGPNEYHKGFMSSVVYQFYNQLQDTSIIKLFKSYKDEYGDGEQKRDFIYVKDVCKVITFFLCSMKISGIFNVGTGKSRSYNELGSCIFNSLGKSKNILYVDMPESIRNSYQYYTEADMSKLIAAGYNEPFYSLEEGIHDYITHYFISQNYYW